MNFIMAITINVYIHMVMEIQCYTVYVVAIFGVVGGFNLAV